MTAGFGAGIQFGIGNSEIADATVASTPTSISRRPQAPRADVCSIVAHFAAFSAQGKVGLWTVAVTEDAPAVQEDDHVPSAAADSRLLPGGGGTATPVQQAPNPASTPAPSGTTNPGTGPIATGTKRFFYRDAGGALAQTFTWGNDFDVPLTGDWNGDGTTEVGLYRPSTHQFFYRDAGGAVVQTFSWGNSGDVPLTGDWNGDGTTEVGLYRPSTHQFFYRDAGGAVVQTFSWGNSGDVPLTGDWNGDGTTEVGLYRPSTEQFFYRDARRRSGADVQLGQQR